MSGRRARYAKRRARLTEATGAPEPPEPAVDPVAGRILEAKGTADDGGRVFGARIIAVGTSLNGVKYTKSVLEAAASLYEGAKAFDHHRTEPELRSSSFKGLAGYWEGVSFADDGIYGDLHLLPSASHAAEALDASIAAERAGRQPLVGISHDVRADYVPGQDGKRRVREATNIVQVLSADIVADPSAGGRVVRMVAGGLEVEPEGVTDPDSTPAPDPRPDPTPVTPPEEETMTLKELLALLKAAKDAKARTALMEEHKDALEKALEGAGFTVEDVPVLLGDADPGGKPDPATAGGENPPTPAPAPSPAPATPPAAPPPTAPTPTGELASAGAGHVTEAYVRGSMMGDFLIHRAVTNAGLPETMEAKLTARLPERFTEGELVAEVGRTVDILQAAGGIDVPAPRGGRVRITEEAADTARLRMEATFNQGFTFGDENGQNRRRMDPFIRLSEAFFSVTGENPGRWFSDTPAMAHHIIRESWGGPTTGDMGGHRMTEALTTTSWGEVLADVMNKRLMMEYARPDLQLWRRLVTTSPFIDFRSQKIIRVGGYGTLPTVNEGAPYQELVSPGDEQVTYTPSKRGGIESYTWEMAINDDMRRLTRIPAALALAAAVTLNQAIWDIFTTNPNLADGFPLFDNTNHGNSAAGTALSETGLNNLRQKMRDQTAYGDQTGTPLGLIPDFLLVPNELEDQANKLTKGPALLPGGTSYASDQPNLHVGMEYVVVDRWTDANDYIVMAGPDRAPTIEVGFLQGRENPELFVQDDPNVGSMFNADKVTWKIRHVWGYGVLDHRPFQRMTN
jgi:hypothetical protein